MRLRGPAAGAALLLTLVTVGPAYGQRRPALDVRLSPASGVAGAPVELAFTVTATRSQDGVVAIALPAGWQAPPDATVAVDRGTCKSATLEPGATGTLQARFKCAKGRAFTIRYVSPAPTLAAASQFAASVSDGLTTVPLATSPSFQVVAGPAADLRLEGLTGAVAGSVQTVTVRAVDQFGNTATTYNGTVAFTASDPKADYPGAYVFTAGDAGQRGFPVTLKTAGAQSVFVFDPVGFQDTQVATVVPGPAASLSVVINPSIDAFRLITTTNCNYRPLDAYGNITTDYAGAVTWSSTDAAAVLPAPGAYDPLQVPICQMRTAGSQTVTVTDQANPVITGSATTTVNGPRVADDAVIITDPTHFGGITAHALDPLANDGSTFTTSPLRLVRVSQATFTDDQGIVRQLGETSVTVGGGSFTLDLFPSAALTPTPPAASVWRCSPDGQGGVCLIGVPITITYVATDSVNEVSATMTVTLNTPNTYQFPVSAIAPPEAYPTIGPNGAYIPNQAGTVDFLPITINTTLTNARPNAGAGTVSFTVTTPWPCPTPGATGCNVSAEMELIVPPTPGEFNFVGLRTNLTGVTSPPPRANAFSSVQVVYRAEGVITEAPIIIAAVANLQGFQGTGFDGQIRFPICCVPSLLGRDEAGARQHLLDFGLTPVNGCKPKKFAVVESQNPAPLSSLTDPRFPQSYPYPYPFLVTLNYDLCEGEGEVK